MIAGQWPASGYPARHFYYPQTGMEQLGRIAAFPLIETETVSDTVGGPPKIATVTLEGGLRLRERDVRRLICENRPRLARHRRAMIGRLCP